MPASPRRTRILVEVLTVYTLAIGLIVTLYQFKGVPLINRYLWTLAMLMQVYVPAWMLQRQRKPLSASGLHLQGWRQGLKLWMLCSLLIIPPTIFGHHIWQQWLGQPLNSRSISYRQFSHDLRGEPTGQTPPQRIQIYADKRRPILTIRWQEPLIGRIYSDGKLTIVSGSQWVSHKGKDLHVSGGSVDAFATIQLRCSGGWVRYQFWRDGESISHHKIRLGPQQQPSTPTGISRNWDWIFYLLVMQVLMVALPEEMFYRGYIQTRLDAVFPVRMKWGIPLSWGNVLTSFLFAITHFLIGFEPHRLSVFVPSLMFGALKHRTNSLLAPILFHATSNILVKLLELWYL